MNPPKCEPTEAVAIFKKHTGKPAMMSKRCLNCGTKMVAAKADGKWYYFHPFIYGEQKE